MRINWPAFLLGLAALLFALAEANAECLPSIKAVRAAHYPTVSVRWDKEHECFYAINVKPSKERKVKSETTDKTGDNVSIGRRMCDRGDLRSSCDRRVREARSADHVGGYRRADDGRAGGNVMAEFPRRPENAQSQSDRAISETTGAAVVQAGRWLALYEESLQPRAMLIPNVIIPASEPVAAAALPARAHASTVWQPDTVGVIKLILKIIAGFVGLAFIGWVWKWRQQRPAYRTGEHVRAYEEVPWKKEAAAPWKRAA